MAQNLAVRVLLQGRDQVTGATQKARRGLNRLGERGSKTFNAIRNAAIAAGGAIATYLGGRAVIGAFRSVVGEAATLEEAMARIQAVTGAADEDIEKLRQTAVELGETTQFTADQAAGAIENLGRAGLTTSEQIQAVPQVLNLATAAGLGLSEAASVVTKTVNGMGLEFSETGRVADVLTKTTQSADTNIRKLQQGLSLVAPVAKAADISLEETAASIATLQDNGLEATRAGTGLRKIILDLQDPTSTFSEALADAGIETRNLNEVIEKLQRGGAGARAAINALGNEAIPAMEVLLEQGAGTMREFTGELENADGAASEAAATMRDTLNNALQRLNSAWNTVKRTVGEPVLDTVRASVERLQNDLQRLNDSGQLQRIGKSIESAFKRGERAIRSFLGRMTIDGAVDRVTSSLSTLGSAFSKITATVRIVGNTFITVWKTIEGAVGGVIGGLIKGFGLLLSAISKVANGLASLGVVSDQFAKSLERQKNAIHAAGDETLRYARESLGEATDAAGSAVEATGDLVSEHNKAAHAAREHGQAEQEAAEKTEEAAASFDELAETTRGVTKALDEQDQSARSSWVQRLQKEAEEAKTHLEELRNSSDATQREIFEASEAYRKAQEKASQATEALAQESKDAESATEQLANAMGELGVETQASLQQAADQSRQQFEVVRNSAKATRADVAAAFEAYAEDAIKANQGVISAELKTEAQTLRLSNVLEGMGQSAKKGADQAETEISEVGEASKQAADHADQAAADTAASVKQAADAAGSGIGRIVEAARQEFSEVSEAAAQEFDKVVKEAANANSSFSNFFSDLADGRDRIQRQLESERAAVQRMEQTIAETGNSTEDLATIADYSVDQFELLGDQRLSGVRSAIKSAKQQLDQMRSSAKDTLQSLQEELLQLQGREAELTRQRNENRRQDLQEQLAQAEAAGDEQSVQTLQKAIDKLDRVAELEEKRAREQQRQEREAEQQRSTPAPSSGDSSAQREPDQLHEVQLTTGSGSSVGFRGSPEDVEDTVEQLRRAGARTT